MTNGYEVQLILENNHFFGSFLGLGSIKPGEVMYKLESLFHGG